MNTHEIDYFRMLHLDAESASRMKVDALRDCVRVKKKEWTMQSSNPLFQQDARSKLDQIRSLESLLEDCDGFAAYAARMVNQQRDMRATHEQSVGRMIRVALGSRKSITPSQRELLEKHATESDIPVSVVDTMLKRLRVTIGEPLPVVRQPHSLPYLQPALDRTTLAQINAWLTILNCESFYELLDTPLNTPVPAIRRDAQFLFEKWSKVLPKSSEVVAWEKSLQACLTYLKDAASKQRYDAAITNQRMDEFVKQVDLVLASGVLDKESQMELARIGMRQWGFSTRIIEQCIQSRASKSGLHNEKPVSVSMRMDGQLQCMRCFAWSPSTNQSCWHCGCTVTEKCKNPDCRSSLSPSTKRCDQCALPVSQGRRFLAFLESADTDLANGEVASALETCRHARRILPSPAVASRIKLAGKVLAQVAVAQHSFSVRALSATHAALVKLTELSPEFQPPGVPSLSRLAQEMRMQQQRLQTTEVESSVDQAAKTSSQVLSCWSDSNAAFQKLWVCCESLAASGKHSDAVRYAMQLRANRPGDQYVADWVQQLQTKLSNEKQDSDELRELQGSLEKALKENRLYAARQCLDRLMQSSKPSAESVSEFRRKVRDLTQALAETKRRAASSQTRDAAIGHYLDLLARYPDCRDALSIVQRAKPDPPLPPIDLFVSVDSDSRHLRWTPPERGKRPSSYRLYRLEDSGTSLDDHSNATIIYQGPDRQFVDSAAISEGSIATYFVKSVFHYHVERSGRVLCDAELQSVSSEPLEVAIGRTDADRKTMVTVA